MTTQTTDPTGSEPLIRKHDMLFCHLYARTAHPAHHAALLLTGLAGIDAALPHTPHSLQLRYRLERITYSDIEQVLIDAGFHLDNSLLSKLKRALIHYSEDTARANLGCEKGRGNCTRDIFVNRYQRLEHGCRDHRPEPWRHYL